MTLFPWRALSQQHGSLSDRCCRGDVDFNQFSQELRLASPKGNFADLVVPELQKRGLFRTEYEGATLRDNLGLSRPESRYK